MLLPLSLINMVHTLPPVIDFSCAVSMRIYQSCGLAFLFVPINTLMYARVPHSKNNQVSGIVNLARNLGGSIGIAFVTTVIARRSQGHQANLSAHFTAGDLSARLAGFAHALQHAGAAALQAKRMAFGAIYRQLIEQSQTLAYLDVLFLLGVFAALMIPAVLLTRPAKPGVAAS